MQHALLRRGSTQVSTIFRKSVRFFIINIFFNNEKLFPSWNLANIPSEWLRNQRKGDFKELKIQNFPGEAWPGPSRSLHLRQSFRKSVSIYPRSAPLLYPTSELLIEAQHFLAVMACQNTLSRTKRLKHHYTSLYITVQTFNDWSYTLCTKQFSLE